MMSNANKILKEINLWCIPCQIFILSGNNDIFRHINYNLKSHFPWESPSLPEGYWKSTQKKVNQVRRHSRDFTQIVTVRKTPRKIVKEENSR
jgi:hypothetical protein